MQQKSSHTFVQSKMNKDLDSRLISAGEYRDGVNVAVSRSEASDVGALENIIGNIAIIPFGKSGQIVAPIQVIGWYFDDSNDRVFVYITNYQDNSETGLDNFAPADADCRIVYVDLVNKFSKTIVVGNFLNFSINSPIDNSNMIENLLFWTDNRNQPRKINVDTAIADSAYYNHEDHISVAKYYPYKGINLLSEMKFDDMLFVDKFDNGRDYNISGQVFPNRGYTAIYDFLVFNTDPPQNVIDKLKNNIGVKGYLQTSGNKTNPPRRFEFRVAWFQKDEGQQPDGIAGRLPGSYRGKYMLFLDRQLQIKPSTDPQDGNAGFYKFDIQNPPQDVANYEYSMCLVEETIKNVSDPWESDSVCKFQLERYNSSGSNIKRKYYIYDMTDRDVATQGYLSQIFLFGTRSRVIDLTVDFKAVGTSTYPEYNFRDLSATIQSVNAPVFNIPNGFPENVGDAKNIYPRIKHPKLPDDRIFIITEALWRNSPSTSLGVEIKEFINTGPSSSIVEVDIYKEFGVEFQDVLEVYLPNKYYKQNFPGDPIFLKDKFIRFAYRFKFDDGEYSVISPFTQNVFIPKQKGYFQTVVGKSGIDANPEGSAKDPTRALVSTQKINSAVHQVQLAGQSTEVEWFTNSITEVDLRIPLDFPASELKDRLKVSEIDILYKESDGLSLKVVETLDVKALANVQDNFIEYTYQSRKPIKTLPADEIGRVYDQVPIRALTQSTSGNRIIYGNYIDRHSSPLNLKYEVGISSKFTPSYPNTTNSDVKYPNHTLKQNRNYQVGLILSDRYGRSTDVILSSVEDETTVVDTGLYASNRITFGGSTIYSKYFDNVEHLFNLQATANPTNQIDIERTENPRAGIIDWPGDSLKLRFPETIPNEIPGLEGYPGLYQFPIPNPTVSTADSSVALGNKTSKVVNGSLPKKPLMELVSSSVMSPVAIASVFKVGNVVRWDFNGEMQQAVIEFVNYTDNNELIIGFAGNTVDPNYWPVVPSAPDKFFVFPFSPISNLGFYSYRVVVKQNEQSYSNVYLPSLLQGNPIVKPYSLYILANPTKTNIITLDQNKLAEPATFPVLEGQIINIAESYNQDSGAYLLDLDSNSAGTEFVLNQLYDLTGGTGTGAQIRCLEVGENKELIDFFITRPGTGYVVGETLQATPSGGTAANLDVASVYSTNFTKVAVVNVLNNEQIEVSQAVTVAGENNNTTTGDTTTGGSIEHEFSSSDNGATINCTTLLTDNANKVPPSLNETTPVQQQYSTSDTQLIPRVAMNNRTEVVVYPDSNTRIPVNTVPPTPPNVPRTPTGDWTFPIYPGKETLKVRAIGDFESMFVDGRYNGLWQADTNPPTCTIDNRFSLGRDAQTALPIGKEYYQAAIYETTPVVSQLDIFFETSTSGRIDELNSIILNPGILYDG